MERQRDELYKFSPLTKEPAKEIAGRFVKEREAKGEIFRDSLKDGSSGPEMIWLPAGQFRMGDVSGGSNSDELPVHEVSLKRFAIGRYEVTFEESDRFAEATGINKPNDGGWGRGKRPVIQVCWHDAVAYSEWLSKQTNKPYRLPSEA